MTGRVEILDTNKATQDFFGAVDSFAQIWENESKEIVLLFFGIEYYLSEVKISIKENVFLIKAMMTDGVSFVGRVVFNFYPKEEDNH